MYKSKFKKSKKENVLAQNVSKQSTQDLQFSS